MNKSGTGVHVYARANVDFLRFNLLSFKYLDKNVQPYLGLTTVTWKHPAISWFVNCDTKASSNTLVWQLWHENVQQYLGLTTVTWKRPAIPWFDNCDIQLRTSSSATAVGMSCPASTVDECWRQKQRGAIKGKRNERLCRGWEENPKSGEMTTTFSIIDFSEKPRFGSTPQIYFSTPTRSVILLLSTVINHSLSSPLLPPPPSPHPLLSPTPNPTLVKPISHHGRTQNIKIVL